MADVDVGELASCSHSPLLFALVSSPRSLVWIFLGFRFLFNQGPQPGACMASHLAAEGLLSTPTSVWSDSCIHFFLQVDLLAWAVPIGSTSPAFSCAIHVTG